MSENERKWVVITGQLSRRKVWEHRRVHNQLHAVNQIGGGLCFVTSRPPNRVSFRSCLHLQATDGGSGKIAATRWDPSKSDL